MSGLTKKVVVADQHLSAILGVKEGELVSYSQLSKGLHKYIKDNDLKNPERKQSLPPTTQPVTASAPHLVPQPTKAEISSTKKCRDCGEEIVSAAIFCDVCGVRQ